MLKHIILLAVLMLALTAACADNREPTPTPAPTATTAPTATPAPTVTPVPTATPAPTVTPVPTATPAPTATPSIKWGLINNPVILTSVTKTSDLNRDEPFILQACHSNSGVNEDGHPVKYFLAVGVGEGAFVEVAGFSPNAKLTAKRCYNMAVEFVENKGLSYSAPISTTVPTIRLPDLPGPGLGKPVWGTAFRLIHPEAFEWHRYRR